MLLWVNVIIWFYDPTQTMYCQLRCCDVIRLNTYGRSEQPGILPSTSFTFLYLISQVK